MANQLGTSGATFQDVWEAYPDGNPCTNPTFSNQCAIRVSHALLECDVDLSGFRGTRCWNDSSKYNTKHIIRAEEFANWLKQTPLRGLGPTLSVSPEEYQSELTGKTGIVFFKDYWQRSNESVANRSGDHIDLWNRNRTTGQWFSWSRGFWETVSPSTSDQNQSREVLFWNIS